MKQKNYVQSKTVKKLRELERRGKKSVIWSLRPDMVEFLSRFYDVCPYLYSIRTRRFPNIRYIDNRLLREIHFSNIKRKEFVTKHLKEEDLHILSDNDVNYRVVKYLVVLN